MKCQCGASGFRGHMLMVRRLAFPPHPYTPVPPKKEVPK